MQKLATFQYRCIFQKYSALKTGYYPTIIFESTPANPRRTKIVFENTAQNTAKSHLSHSEKSGHPYTHTDGHFS
jgi:hypothetical protein